MNLKQKDSILITDSKVIKLLNKPLIRDIINCLSDSPKTATEISTLVTFPKDKIYYHIKNLIKHDILYISDIKKINGVDQKMFLQLVNYLKRSKYLNLKCLSVHIGSQILNLKPYENMLKVIAKTIKKSNYKFEYIDLGGGMGIDYDHNNSKLDLKKYSKSIEKFLKINQCKIIFEPGRSIIANTAILITKVIYIKEGYKKDFVILDAGMNDLMRPALYGAEHKIIPYKKTKKSSTKNYEFVGPICESTDTFANVKNFQKLNEKDFLVICDVGAYGTSLASNYNVRPKPIEILIRGSKIQILKKRQKISELI